jgi:spore coat polysaccharide biosynthesis protein SpsF
MGSTRLPGKVLADIAGTPLIVRLLERIRVAHEIDAIVVATTTDAEDDELVKFLGGRSDCQVFRGSRNDVLDRFYRCAVEHHSEIVVRVTADDPLKDPQIVGRAVRMLMADPRLEYCSNTLEPTYPEGLDIEAFTIGALKQAWLNASLASEREHVTPFIWKNPDRFRIANFRHERDLSAWRWTVDKPNDLQFMRAVYGHFADNPLVTFQEVIAWLESRSDVRGINSDTTRDEGYLSSGESERQQ